MREHRHREGVKTTTHRGLLVVDVLLVEGVKTTTRRGLLVVLRVISTRPVPSHPTHGGFLVLTPSNVNGIWISWNGICTGSQIIMRSATTLPWQPLLLCIVRAAPDIEVLELRSSNFYGVQYGRRKRAIFLGTA